MRKKGILLAVTILLIATGLIQAQEAELTGTIDVTYLSSYIWRGFDMYSEGHSAIQPSIDLDLYGTGFGVNILMSRANSSGFENSEELRYTLRYINSLLADETYTTDYTVGYTYYSYPDMPKNAYNMQEAFVALSWPKICPEGIVPSYTVVCSWPAEGNSSSANDSGGWLHIIGLGYDVTVPGFVPETTEQILHLSAAVVYNDSAWDFVSPGGDGSVDSDWSHAVFGVSTAFDVAESLTLTPGLYYQASMDDSVNDDDETWASLSMTYAF